MLGECEEREREERRRIRTRDKGQGADVLIALILGMLMDGQRWILPSLYGHHLRRGLLKVQEIQHLPCGGCAF